ncbi:DUF3238 domain-containing protein [Haladaptatus salinisoli]|uniref:DUF3238 domain-containing protein n=1 Tax=Haladaptatus salinisoli TaxID=2884876 RepID=UPI001D0BD187|nr:DUF3238 domain-containing protein [Haladaptatus salinisoli]
MSDDAEIVKLRAAVFIPSAWLSRANDADRTLEFRGDDREFTPHAVNTGRSRVEQEAVVDFARETLSEFADTGRSVERITRPDGTEERREGKASADGIFCTDPEWHDGGVEFVIHASASNPLVPHPHPVDYQVELAVDRDGGVEARGRHDGFPCFEFYAQTDFGEFRTLYRHDFRETGDSLSALAGPMEYEFEATLPLDPAE